MAITRTGAQLAEAVMEDLGLLAPGETPSARDQESITRRYANILEELRDEQTLYWSTDAIPHECFEALVNVVGMLVMPSFGFPAPKGEDMERALNGAKRRIRKHVVKPASNTPVAADDGYF